MADDELAEAYQRVQAANARLDELWPRRVSDPEAVRRAINELNDAGLKLNEVYTRYRASS
jgi:DNA-binding winged helix-turn-helix (wHTH) protein